MHTCNHNTGTTLCRRTNLVSLRKSQDFIGRSHSHRGPVRGHCHPGDVGGEESDTAARADGGQIQEAGSRLAKSIHVIGNGGDSTTTGEYNKYELNCVAIFLLSQYTNKQQRHQIWCNFTIRDHRHSKKVYSGGRTSKTSRPPHTNTQPDTHMKFSDYFWPRGCFCSPFCELCSAQSTNFLFRQNINNSITKIKQPIQNSKTI
jgi:hypothetical protein